MDPKPRWMRALEIVAMVLVSPVFVVYFVGMVFMAMVAVGVSRWSEILEGSR